VEPFSTVLFKTGDIVALLTVGSEMTPMCKATVNVRKKFLCYVSLAIFY